jgi:hypothetical protein
MSVDDSITIKQCLEEVDEDARKRNVTLSITERYKEARQVLEIKKQMAAALQQPQPSSSPSSSSSLPSFPTNASLPNSNQSINLTGSQNVNITYMQTNDAVVG